MTTSTPTSAAPPVVYHRTVDQVLLRHLKTPAAVTALRRQASADEPDPLTGLLHAAALQLAERHIRLARAVKHLRSDLDACSTELALGRCAENLLIGRGDELAILAHRHRDALDHLEALARLWRHHQPSDSNSAALPTTTGEA